MDQNWVTLGRDYDIDRWYSSIEHLTMKTYFIPVSVSECDAMNDFYRAEYSIATFSSEKLECIKRLLGKIGHEIDSFISNHKNIFKWFVRMSCRSPKDGIPSTGLVKFIDIAKECKLNVSGLEGINFNEMDSNTINDLIKRYFVVTNASLAVTNGFEAVHLLCTSERIFRDLIKTKESKLETQIILREFDSNILLENEFRCFVYQNRITAISQYDPYVYYESLIKQKNVIKSLILKFYEANRETIPFVNCIMDVVLLYEPEIVNVKIIEFNPFDQYTGAGLFDWNKDEHFLQSNSNETIIRFRESPIEKISDVAQAIDCNVSSDYVNFPLRYKQLLPIEKSYDTSLKCNLQ